MSGTKVTKLDKKTDSVVATIDDGKGKPVQLEVDRVISAVGVVGNIEGIGLEKLGVKTDRGCIVIDGTARPTSPASTPSAMSRALRCLRTRLNTKASSASKPSRDCIRIRWTSAHPGLHLLPSADRLRWPHRGEGEGGGQRHPVGASIVGNGKAIAQGEDQGFVKVIFDKKTGQCWARTWSAMR
jgi:dihydrolipoamide dehydrogenase